MLSATNNFISEEVKEKRQKDWDAFFLRVTSNVNSNIEIPISDLEVYSALDKKLSDKNESVLSLPKQKTYRKIKKMYKSYKLRKLRRKRKIAKKWLLLSKRHYINISEKYQLNNEINKLEINTMNKIEEPIISNSENSLIKENNKSSDIVTNHSDKIIYLNAQNKPVNGIRSKQLDIEYSDNSTKMHSRSSCDIINADKLMEQCNYQQEEKLDYTKNIFKKFILTDGIKNNIRKREVNKESQTDNCTDNTHFKTRYERYKYDDKENINYDKSIKYKKNTNLNNICDVLLDSKFCNADKKYKISNDLGDKLPYSEKNSSLLNYIEQQEMLNNEINTTKPYTQETNNSVYLTNKRKINSEFSDTLQQSTKKRKTMTLQNLINESMTQTSTTKKVKGRKSLSFYSDDADNKKIEESDIVILLTMDDFLNDSF